MRRTILAIALTGAVGTAAAAPSDYPTSTLADYVFACMASNGQTREMLNRCSCSVDVIASIIPHERYVEAETVLSLGRVPGERTGIFRDDPQLREAVNDLRRAQAEAEIRCF